VSKWTELNSSMNRFFDKMKVLSIVGGTFLLAATSCKLGDDPAPLPPVAYVSLYQASPNSPDLNVKLDDKIITYSLGYTDQTGYLRFVTGDRKLEFGPSGADNIVADTTMKFEEGKAYSLFVVNTYDKAGVLVLNDDTDTPAKGKAKVRFLNLSPDSPPLDLRVGDSTTSLFSGQAFKKASDFVEVDANSYVFKVKLASGDDVLLTMPDAILLDGWSYTVIVRGFKTPPGGSQSVLSAELIVD
jgi:hypothetical protein